MKKIIPLVVAAALGVGFATAAEAHVSVGIGIGIPVAPAYPVYAAPPPVYYAPRAGLCSASCRAWWVVAMAVTTAIAVVRTTIAATTATVITAMVTGTATIVVNHFGARDWRVGT